MNDFTKEELQSLLSTIENVRIYTEIENWDEDLHAKIQSMLDNYCDHKETSMDCDGGISLVCTNCGYTVVDI